MTIPPPIRPRIETGYGIHTGPEGMLDWGEFRAAFESSRNYWVGSTRTDGRPHAAPVWGLWLDDRLHFSTDPKSVKGRNLAARPDVLVHLESGDDTYIIEGRVERLTDRDVLVRFATAYDAKYSVRPDPDDPGILVYAVQPRIAYAWHEKNYPESATCWRWS